jgi:hypothetical protein
MFLDGLKIFREDGFSGNAEYLEMISGSGQDSIFGYGKGRVLGTQPISTKYRMGVSRQKP